MTRRLRSTCCRSWAKGRRWAEGDGADGFAGTMQGLSGGYLPALALQMVQAPVFHGYVVSMLVEIGKVCDGERGGGGVGGRSR